MDFMILSVIIFFMSLVVIELSLYAHRNMQSTRKSKINKRLRKYVLVEDDFGDILKKRNLSDIPFLNRMLLSLPIVSNLDKLVLQANAKQTLGIYVLLAFLLGALGTLGGQLYLNNALYSLFIGGILFFSPYAYLVRLKTKRTEKFQSQLHEALDLIARALKAGHSFSASLKLAATEFKDPLGTEFEETLDEINFGVSVPAALKNLAERVDCKEIKYFVIAVIIQRETGGNLAELIESLAHIVRERFKFEGRVRILSAEGRLSGVVLILIPILIGGWLQFSSPEFMRPLFEEPIGRILLGIAGIMMVVGALVMKKMVKIEV
jgi:tight adherence protein B